MALLIQETGDGSHTLFSEEYNEIYHSRRGAWQESEHVFIHSGLDYVLKQLSVIHILEVGFGTGLNAMMTLDHAAKNNTRVFYTGLEPIPVDFQLIEQLNYPQFLKDETLQALFRKMHQCPWDTEEAISPDFTLLKSSAKIENFQADISYDLVYFDAFGPSKQPEIWDIKIFEMIKSLMKPGAVLVTYSSKGQLKRDLKNLNFEVQSLPGPPGKREMTRAVRLV